MRNKDIIPDDFYRGDLEHPIADSVGELIQILKRLPPEMRLSESYEIIVYNIKSQEPIVGIEEL